MATSSQQLSFAIKAVNEASKALKDVQGDIGAIQGQAEKSGSKLSGFNSALGGVATVAGGIVAAGALSKIGGYLTNAVQGAIEDEAATKRLEQALRNAGGAWDENLEKVNAAIDAGAKKAFTDDQVRDSFQTLLAATGDVNTALERQQLAYDLSRGAGISLEAATKMVSKVNEESVDGFKRLGITIADGATEAEALAAVQAKFAGQADTYAQSTAGQFEQAKIRMAEVQEEIGAKLLPVVTKLGLIFLNDVVPAIEKFVSVAGPKVSEFATKVKGYWESDIKPALDAMKAAWEKLEPAITPILNQIANVVENTVRTITLALGIVVDLLGGDFSGAWEKAKALVEEQIRFIKESVGNLVDFIEGLVPLVLAAAQKVGGAIIDGIKAGIGAMADLAGDIATTIGNAVKGLINTQIIDPINRVLEFKIAIPGAPDINVNPPDIPHLAVGGIVTRPTLALIAEAGPEAVVPLSRGGAGGGFAGMVVNNYITVQGSVWSLDELAYELNRRGLVA